MELRELLRAAGRGIVLVASLVLLGCGGGEDRITTLSSDGPAFVEGTAMLGTVTGATVTAVELNANGAELHTLVTTSTDGQGSYHFLLGPGYQGGPILLKLRGGGGATALCDVTGGCGDGYEWGAAVPLASSVEMRALLPPASSGARIHAQITPFTHMAEARARANAGGLSAAVINAANSEVSHLVGVDVLATTPADLLDELSVSSADGRVYAAFISAATAWMVENGGYQAGLAALAQMFLDGQFTQVDGDYAFIEALAGYLREEADAIFPEAETPAEVAHAVAVLDEADVGCESDGSCVYDPEPASAPAASVAVAASVAAVEDPAVAQARALVEELRGWFYSIGDLEDPLAPFQADLGAATAAFDANSAALLDGFGKAVKAVIDNLGDRVLDGLRYDQEYSAVLKTDAGEVLGRVRYMLKDDAGTLALHLYGSDVPGLTLDVTLDTGLPSLTLYTWSVWNLREANITVAGSLSNDQVTIGLTSLALTVSLEAPFTFNPLLARDPPEPVVVGLRMEGGFALTAASASFRGLGGLQLVPLAAPADGSSNTLSLSWCRLAGRFEAAGGDAFSARLELFVNNAGQFDTLAFLASGSSEFENEGYFADAVLSLTLELALTGHPAATATLTVDRTALDAGGAIMTLRYEDQSLTFHLSRPSATETVLRVTTPDGAALDLTLVDDEVSGTLSVDGNEVATVETRDNGLVLLHYADGSFESLQW